MEFHCKCSIHDNKKVWIAPGITRNFWGTVLPALQPEGEVNLDISPSCWCWSASQCHQQHSEEISPSSLPHQHCRSNLSKAPKMPQAKSSKMKYLRYLIIGNHEFSAEHALLVSVLFFFLKPILIRQLLFVLCIVYSTFVPFLRLSHFISGKENHTSALQRSEPVFCCFLTPSSFLCSLSVVFYLFQAHFLKLWFVQRKWNFTSKNVMHGTDWGGNTIPEWKTDFRWNWSAYCSFC